MLRTHEGEITAVVFWSPTPGIQGRPDGGPGLACGCGRRLRSWGRATGAEPPRPPTVYGDRLRPPPRARSASYKVASCALPGSCLSAPRRHQRGRSARHHCVSRPRAPLATIAANSNVPAPPCAAALRPRPRPALHWLYRASISHATALHPDVLNHTEPAQSMLQRRLDRPRSSHSGVTAPAFAGHTVSSST